MTTLVVELLPALISRLTAIVSIQFKIRVKRTHYCARFGVILLLDFRKQW